MGKKNPEAHLTDHHKSGKTSGHRGKAMGNRMIKPAASSLKTPSQKRLTRSQLHKVHI
jgi:hypothetical protein